MFNNHCLEFAIIFLSDLKWILLTDTQKEHILITYLAFRYPYFQRFISDGTYR